MKKLFALLAVTAIITSCNDTSTTSGADSDSAKAAATADSLAAIKALADTSNKNIDTVTMKMDGSMPKAKDSAKPGKKVKDSTKK